MSIFTPKWKNPDTQTRMEAIANLRKEKALKWVFKFDKKVILRIAAFQILIDKGFINDVFIDDVLENEKNEQIRTIAIKQIRDPAKLQKIVTTTGDEKLQLIALKKVCNMKQTDQQFIVHIAKHGITGNLRIQAVKHVQDDQVLLKSALSDASPGVCEAAIKRISNENWLYQIAEEKMHEASAIIACKKISDQLIIERIVNGSFPFNIKHIVLQKFKNSEKVYSLLSLEKDRRNQGEIIRLIQDQAILFRIATNNAFDTYLQQIAIERLNDPKRLMLIVSNNEFLLKNRIAAISQIKERKILERLATDDNDIKIREVAKKYIVYNSTDINTVGRVFPATTSREERTRNRIAQCENCNKVMFLNTTSGYTAEWDRHWAYYYFCPKCNPSPDPKNSMNWYSGYLIGSDGKQIIDQEEYQ